MTQKAWFDELSAEDLQFIRRFILASGSLKAVAQEYGVSYPTVRLRLDRLIAKIQALEDSRERSPFHRKVRALMAEGRLGEREARALLEAHDETVNGD